MFWVDIFLRDTQSKKVHISSHQPIIFKKYFFILSVGGGRTHFVVVVSFFIISFYQETRICFAFTETVLKNQAITNQYFFLCKKRRQNKLKMIFPMQKIMKCTIKRFSRLSLKIRTKKGERSEYKKKYFSIASLV